VESGEMMREYEAAGGGEMGGMERWLEETGKR
jgi:hypothetical protein